MDIRFLQMFAKELFCELFINIRNDLRRIKTGKKGWRLLETWPSKRNKPTSSIIWKPDVMIPTKIKPKLPKYKQNKWKFWDFLGIS